MNINRRGFLFSAVATALAGCRSVGDGVAAGPRTIRIAHCGDPQFGFGREVTEAKYRDDLARFEAVIDRVNAEKVDLCFIAGDMTHRAVDLERDWPRLVGRFKVPFVVTPGNHDMGQNLTRENVERFERVFGYEYRSLKVGAWRFISGNSQYWRPTEEKERFARYEKWLADELAAAKAAGEPVILASHIPPFVGGAGEEDSYENHPKAGRGKRIDSYLAAGAKFYLAGHTHRMIARAIGGMTILNAETTCCNFDGLPYGFRMLTLRGDGGYTWDFQEVS